MTKVPNKQIGRKIVRKLITIAALAMAAGGSPATASKMCYKTKPAILASLESRYADGFNGYN